jgi:uncharacterized protein (TIGR02246 family)
VRRAADQDEVDSQVARLCGRCPDPAQLPANNQREVTVSELTTSANAESEIRTLIENWADAVRRRDYDAILRNHSRDILMFDVPPPLQSKGIEAYRSTWDLFFRWSHDPVVFEIVEMTVTAGADVEFAAAVMRCSGTETTGEHVRLQFRLTVGLRKIDGRWTITHEHHSIPATS